MPEFSIGLDYAWRTAANEAARTRHEFIEPEHLFVGVSKLGNLLSLNDWNDIEIPRDAAAALKAEAEAVAAVFQKAGHDRTALYRDVRKRFGEGKFTDKGRKKISRSPASRLIFERAGKLAADASVVTSLHLLFALLETPGTCIPAALAVKPPGAEVLKQGVLSFIASSPSPRQQPSASFLSAFGKDLTQLARDGKLQPCIGRRDELLQIIRALSRETKNNPVLLGDAGVGKTAIVEGLAWRIAQNKDAALAGKRIVQLNVADLVAGASSRGDFEARMQGLLREVAAAPDVILFIDELHTLVGAGAGSGPLDAANIMKPALARGELRCIGATTLAEYRKYIERDAALERRFQPITVNEPSADEAVEILTKGYLNRFEEKHGVTISPEAIQAVVSLSARFMRERRLPDKAVDLLDDACARIPALAPPQVSAVMLTIQPGADASKVAETISTWPDVTVYSKQQQVNLLLSGMVDKARRQLGLFRVLLIIISTIIMALIIYTLTLDKIHDIAMLKLMGARNGVIVGLILQQALLIGALGYGLAYWLGTYAFPKFPRLVVIETPDLLQLGVIVLGISVLASLVGIGKAMSVEPNKVLS